MGPRKEEDLWELVDPGPQGTLSAILPAPGIERVVPLLAPGS